MLLFLSKFVFKNYGTKLSRIKQNIQAKGDWTNACWEWNKSEIKQRKKYENYFFDVHVRFERISRHGNYTYFLSGKLYVMLLRVSFTAQGGKLNNR